MKLIAATFAFAFLAAGAAAQTPTAPSTPPAAPASAAAPATCADLAPAPTAPAGATATMAQMTAADAAFQAWRRNGVAALECRRQQYDAVIEAMNAANANWGAQIDVYCARRNVRCERIQRPDAPAQPAAAPTH